jgi:hypothetical protein
MSISCISDYLDRPLRTPEQAAETFMRWSTMASQAAVLAAQSGQYSVAISKYKLASEYRRKACQLVGFRDVLTDEQIDRQLREMEAIYRSVSLARRNRRSSARIPP